MAYTPTTWATGDIVTAEKLNKLERGVADAGGYPVIEFALSYNSENEEYEVSACSMTPDEVATNIKTTGDVFELRLKYASGTESFLYPNGFAHMVQPHLGYSGAPSSVDSARYVVFPLVDTTVGLDVDFKSYGIQGNIGGNWDPVYIFTKTISGT